MKNLKLTFLITVLVTWISVFAQVNTVPMMMNYQGKISDSEGNPLNEEVLITFSLYADSEGGVALWSEMQEPVDVSDGIFHVLLGSVENFPENLFDGSTLWLGINVNNDGEMTPRSLLSSVPYSLKTASAGPDDDWQIDGENIYRESGNVGIGTIAPERKLEVSGTDDQFVRIASANNERSGIEFIRSSVIYRDWRIYNDGGNLYFNHNANNFSSGDGTNLLFLTYVNNRIGIGTEEPDATLDVAGHIKSEGMEIEGFLTVDEIHGTDYITSIKSPGSVEIVLEDEDFPGMNSGFDIYHTDGNPIFTVHETGNTKISGGTASVNLLIEADTDNSGETDHPTLTLSQDGGEVLGELGFFEDEGSNNLTLVNRYSGGALNLGAGGNTALKINGDHQFYFYDEDGVKTIEILTHENTTAGQIKLYKSDGAGGMVKSIEINGEYNPGGGAPTQGRITTEVLEITGGSDIAEPFAVNPDEEIRMGCLVSIDPENPGKIKLSDKAYDACVAGVVSGANNINTGLILKQKGSIADGEVPVALTGRVYCKADASFGKINPGDLLTSSSNPGHAMKVKKRRKAQGAIIGKALTGLDSGQGWVLVLVAMQ